MKQVALPEGFDGSTPLEIRGEQFHHLARVRRVRVGARLQGCTPSGEAFALVVSEVGAASLTLMPVAPLEGTDDAVVDITLLQCIPKGPALDQIVRQAVEAGVTRIVPVRSARSVAGDWSGRGARLSRIARSAMEQSGAGRLAVIEEPVALESLAPAPGHAALFLHERVTATLEGAGGFVYSPASVARDAGPGLHDALAAGPAAVDILVGPEGGLASREVTFLLEAGFRPVWLGATVLRVETAAVYALGAVRTLLLERTRWTLRKPG